MAITSYTELKTAIAGWMDRSDLEARIPEFIALAEAQMNRRLRVRPMLTRATATITDEYSALPDDFLGARAFKLSDGQLQFLDMGDLLDLAAANAAAGRPRYYSIVGTEVRYYPSPDSAYTAELAYWAKIPPLSDTNASNWVLASHPDAYLYGALLQGAPYMRDLEAAEAWSSGFNAAIDAIESADVSETFGDRRTLRRKPFK